MTSRNEESRLAAGADAGSHSNPLEDRLPTGTQRNVADPLGQSVGTDTTQDTMQGSGGESDSTKESHATGESIVPQKLQEKLPEGIERAVPDKIHDTSGLPPKDK